MKLHEAMRKLVTLRGREVLARGDLAELLEREHAFDSCPDLRPVIELLVSRGYAGMLLRAGSRGSGPAYSREEGRVRREMARAESSGRRSLTTLRTRLPAPLASGVPSSRRLTRGSGTPRGFSIRPG